MAKKGNSMQRKVSEFTYTRPSIDKRFLKIKKNFNEVTSMLNETKKTPTSRTKS